MAHTMRRDPFARGEYERVCHGRGECAWCGQKRPRVFSYLWLSDGRTQSTALPSEMPGVIFHGQDAISIEGEKDFSLVYPADINDGGRETYFAHVCARDISHAIDRAQMLAADANASYWEDELERESARQAFGLEFNALIVLAGHHYDLL